jgi:hypothetical protein
MPAEKFEFFDGKIIWTPVRRITPSLHLESSEGDGSWPSANGIAARQALAIVSARPEPKTSGPEPNELRREPKTARSQPNSESRIRAR